MAGVERCQAQVQEVTQLMTQNLTRALGREERLRELESRAQSLRALGEAFTRSTRAVAGQKGRSPRRRRLVAFGLLGLFLLLLLLLLGLVLGLPRPPAGTAPAPGTEPPGNGPAGADGGDPTITNPWERPGETLQ